MDAILNGGFEHALNVPVGWRVAAIGMESGYGARGLWGGCEGVRSGRNTFD